MTYIPFNEASKRIKEDSIKLKVKAIPRDEFFNWITQSIATCIHGEEKCIEFINHPERYDVPSSMFDEWFWIVEINTPGKQHPFYLVKTFEELKKKSSLAITSINVLKKTSSIPIGILGLAERIDCPKCASSVEKNKKEYFECPECGFIFSEQV